MGHSPGERHRPATSSARRIVHTVALGPECPTVTWTVGPRRSIRVAVRGLLGLRLALIQGRISPPTFEAAIAYDSPVPLFVSGAEAADHGQAEIRYPGIRRPTRNSRRRTDIV
ncbi:DUF6283 family protein [Nocardia sp. NPDC004711]